MVDDNSQHRKANGVNRIGTYKVNKTFLSCFDDEICILNNGHDALALGY